MRRNSKKIQKQKKSKVPVPKHIELKGFLSFFILHELNSESMSGDELAVSIGERKGSDLTPGTIYPALKRLRRQKLIKYGREGRKKMYYLTKEGKKELAALYIVLGRFFSGLKSRIKR